MTEHNDSRTAPSGQVRPAPAALPVDAPLFSRAAWARILPFGAYIFFIILGDMLERTGMARADLRWLYSVQIGVVALLLAVFWRGYHELRRPLPGAGHILAAIAAGVLVLLLWINLDAPWMTVGSSPGYDPRSNGELDWVLIAIRIAGATLVVPVMEELFWRSFVMRWVDAADFETLEPVRVGIKGFLVSVVLFGFEHNLWLAGIVAGVAYSLLYMRHGNLWSAVIAHAVTNGLLGVWVVATGNWAFW